MSFGKTIIKKYKRLTDSDFISEVQWMYVYAKKYWTAIVFYCVIGAIGTVMGLFGSVMTKKLIDVVTGYDKAKLAIVIAALLGMGIGNIVMNAITGRISAKISIKVQNEIQADVYDKIMEADWESLYEFRSGDLLNRLSWDVSSVANCVIGWIPSLITKLVQFIGALIIILYYDPTMAVIALMSAPVSIVVSRILLRRMREYNKKLREASSDLMAFQEDSFQNIQSIKSFGIVSQFKNDMKKLQKNYQRLTLEYNVVNVVTTAFMSFVGLLVSYACMGWAVYRLWTGAIIFGTMTMFLQLSSSLTASFSALIGLVPQAIAATTSAGRIMSVTLLPAEKSVTTDVAEEVKSKGVEGGLEVLVEHLDFVYQDGNEVLKDVSMKAKPGQIVALIGPSGEGKTTLIRILLGLVNPTSGKTEIKDSTGKSCQISIATRDAFSYVPQGNTIFAGTIEENLRMVKQDATEEEIIEALKIACAWNFVNRMPDGLHSKIRERGIGLSEGQAQRISIARAILRDAPIILLDEATSALDVVTEKKVLQNILLNKKEKTCIVTTHRPSVLKMCQRIYKIEKTQLTKINPEDITIDSF